MKELNFIILLCFTSLLVSSQTTITLQPGAEGKDATVWNLFPANNYANHIDFVALTRTRQGDITIFRSFLEFDLSSIPAGASILSAKLSLYHNPTSPDVGHEGLNNAYLRRVLEDWSENTITWNNQPASSTANQILLPASITEDQDYPDIDVTPLVRDMIEHPMSSFGFSIELVTEEIYRSMKFASGDYENAALRPKLEITYSTAPPECLTLQPGSEGKDATVWNIMPGNNYGNHQDFVSLARTRQGDLTVFRSYLEFDLSGVPSQSTLVTATLSLYHNPTSPDVGHEGDNQSYLRRVLEPWDENTVTWNQQPATTEENRVLIPTSTFLDQDYTNIDVTALVSDMLESPQSNNGFEIMLITEEIYRSMKFASSDYSNPDLRPKLELCFLPTVGIDHLKHESIAVQPNPFRESFSVTLPIGQYAAVITDATGRSILTTGINSNGQPLQVDAFSDLPPGAYTVLFYGDKTVYFSKLIKTK